MITLRGVIFGRRNFREFQIHEHTFLDRDIGPNEDDLVQNV